MSEAEILALTYFDTFTVKRKVKTVNEDTGITEYENKIIVENVKGAVSKSTSKQSQIMATDGVGKLAYTHELFTYPNTDIREGDTIEVVSCGIKTVYLASKPFHYPSYIVLPISYEGRS